MITIADAASLAQLEAVRGLIRAFIGWFHERHPADRVQIEAYFDAAAVEQELAGLPGPYQPPGGRLLLAEVDGEPAGCIALRPLEGSICEMKRLFVSSRFRGRGVGRLLTGALLSAAREAGYTAMRLDTSVRQAEARQLYRGFGFRPIAPYRDLPAPLLDWLVFLELKLDYSQPFLRNHSHGAIDDTAISPSAA